MRSIVPGGGGVVQIASAAWQADEKASGGALRR
jgi:hypothetical protein